jgi:pimeloyl-ACP methyl ester carboxylesterase
MKTITKHVRTPRLDIAYEEHGPQDGTVALLLHGFPDDVRAWDAIAPQLARDGFRTLAPYARGYGDTRFLQSTTPRSGETAALVQDVVEFADALGVEQFIVVGHDWGARTAYPLAALFPDRVVAIVALGVGYGSGAAKIDAHKPMPVEQASAYWYQWYFNTEKGREALESDRASFCRELWKRWSPGWRHSKAAFDRTARSFENSDFVDVVLHSYRARWENATPDPHYAGLDARMSKAQTIDVPSITLVGADDGAALAKSSEGKEKSFSGYYRRGVLRGVGHFIPREDPEAVLAAVRYVARHLPEETITMATTKQRTAARKNVKKAAAAAKAKKTISKLPKHTRTALGKQGAKVARQKKG